ncbi:hypothetical protein GCM10011519_04940 [Marmoricola endophyticus]|uniref:Calcineurin-like phosphoesterase domain-containing protein n=1 Tax=Marmoricola endophyticus TaxID=2040280 RepID=A0A917BAV4_9ACTN|nr:metallophosphoesterase [Marmoricola endophyticus]GGF34466.1 hypothetical protein GCM10011519_04940 [Marmoricola endophyticus]
MDGTGEVASGVASAVRRTPLRVLHLSDLGLRARRPSGPVDEAERHVESLLHDLRHLPDLDLVVVSGDVSADGSTTSYATARRLIGAFAARHGAPHVYAVGDRDDHDRFGEVLGSGHLGPDDLDYGTIGPLGERTDERHGWVSEVDGLRVVTVDTTLAGSPHGVLGEDQAQWLNRVLDTEGPRGTVLVLHHPPISPGGFDHLGERALRDTDRLVEVVEGSDVRAVLAGHLRVPLTGVLAGTPVQVAPGAVDHTDLTAPVRLDRQVAGGAGVVLEIGAPGCLVSYPVRARRAAALDRVTLSDPRTGNPVADEEVTPTRPTTGEEARALGTHIPAGEIPGPSLALGDDGAQVDTWPDELDSSTRRVAPEPPSDVVPVWLEEAGAEESPAAEQTPVEDPPVVEPPAEESPAEEPPAEHPDAEEPVPLEDSGVLSWAFDRETPGERI